MTNYEFNYFGANRTRPRAPSLGVADRIVPVPSLLWRKGIVMCHADRVSHVEITGGRTP